MYKFIKKNANHIIDLIVSLFSLVYIYMFTLTIDVLYGRSPSFFMFMAGGLFIISGLIFFTSHCGPLLIITCKENLCKIKQTAKVVSHTDKGVRLLVEDTVLILPCKLDKKKHPVDSDLEVFVDNDLNTVYYPIKKEVRNRILGMILSIVYIWIML